MMYKQDEDHDGMRRQAAPPDTFWYPPLPEIAADEAATRMTEGSMWIRSIHFEFYYSYAVVEDTKTAQRHVVKGIIGVESWQKACAPLHEWS